MADWSGSPQGAPEDNGHTFAYFPRFPYGHGYYASPLEPTGLHGLASPILDGTEMVKSSDESKLVEEPSNVAGVSSEEGEAIDLFKCLDGAGQPESLNTLEFHGTELWKTSDELELAVVPSKQLKVPKFDDAQMLNSSNELKLLGVPSVMALNEALGDVPMDPLICPDLADALESQENFRLDAVEQIARNSSQMECRSSHSRENNVAIIPHKSSVAFVKTEQALLGADTTDARACQRDPTQRRASASRRFPDGCGRQSPVLTRQEIEKLRAKAQSLATSKTGISSRTETVRENRFPSRFIVKESGREISTPMREFNCVVIPLSFDDNNVLVILG